MTRGVSITEAGQVVVFYSDCSGPVETVEIFDADEEVIWQSRADEVDFHAEVEVNAEVAGYSTVVSLPGGLVPDATYWAGANDGPAQWGPSFTLEELRVGQVLDGDYGFLPPPEFTERGLGLCEVTLTENLLRVGFAFGMGIAGLLVGFFLGKGKLGRRWTHRKLPPALPR